MPKARQQLEPRTVTVIGGGVSGMSAACALAEAGYRVQLVERRGYLGGRASSYLHPGVNEVIDNCQHVLFGCCTNLIGFYKRVGVENKIHWTTEMTMIEPGGRRSMLGPSSLPAPLHGLPKLLSAHAFTLADKISLARAFRAMMKPVEDERESLANWLRRHKQTPSAVERFWRLVIASALNADLDAIAVPYAAKVIRELFMNSPQAGAMGMSSVPLSELYGGAAQFLKDRGAELHFNTNVESAEWKEQASQWTIHTRTGTLVSEFLIIALPFEAMQRLLPHLPVAPGSEKLAQQIQRFEHWPICSVHLWFDREITNLPHAVLLDREIHWMYNKSVLQPWRKSKGSYLELVQSASRKFAALERQQAIDQALGELAEFFPAIKEAKVEKAALIKEVRATFGVPPGIDRLRPPSTSPWPNCFLAGDWIATGWPSTMESAARSGHLAAEALSASRIEDCRFLEPDLEPQGLMRWL
ncbi:hydroxysqualene dehydroxylase HpnE [Telmatobacter sp. DSM 110680]|uniref:Hydroxysqualene dehydroxylase HpnE n=1 Tax=Telmatobacter sp. DSM 110680 TaxID=3036704 RepID=A0AAU7DE24_9BACT